MGRVWEWSGLGMAGPGNRPGPCMYEMQGPGPVFGRWLAGCPAGFWLIDRLLVPGTRVKFRFPGSFCVPGLPPAWCPSPAVTYFYCPEPQWHKGFRALISRFFLCPQMSTATATLSPAAGSFPPGHPQLPHRRPAGGPAIARPAQREARAGRSSPRPGARAGPEPAQGRPARDDFRASAEAASWLPRGPPHRPSVLSFRHRPGQPVSPGRYRAGVNDAFTSRPVKIIFTT
jgi:hypothetical protein